MPKRTSESLFNEYSFIYAEGYPLGDHRTKGKRAELEAFNAKFNFDKKELAKLRKISKIIEPIYMQHKYEQVHTYEQNHKYDQIYPRGTTLGTKIWFSDEVREYTTILPYNMNIGQLTDYYTTTLAKIEKVFGINRGNLIRDIYASLRPSTYYERNGSVVESNSEYVFSSEDSVYPFDNFPYPTNTGPICVTLPRETIQLMDEERPFNLKHIFGSAILINEGEGNCVARYLNTIHPKCKNIISEMIPIKNVTTEMLQKYCDFIGCAYSVYTMIDFFDRDNGTWIYRTESKCSIMSNRKSSYTPVVGLAYLGHFYPCDIPTKMLKKINPHNTMDLQCVTHFKTDLFAIFAQIVDERKAPHTITAYNITGSKTRLTSIHIDNTIYFDNKFYAECFRLLNFYKIACPYDVTPVMCGKLLEKLFIESNVTSFFPYNATKAPLVIKNKTPLCDEIVSYDINKCYTSALKNLPYLIICNVLTMQINSIQKPYSQELNPSNIYYATIETANILIRGTDFYTGEIINYYQNTKTADMPDVFIYNEFYTIVKKNDYTRLINSLYTDHSNVDLVKDIVNRIIGNFTPVIHTEKNKSTYMFACKNDETNKFVELYENYGIDQYSAVKKILPKLSNKSPIQIQIKDSVAISIHQTLSKHNIKMQDIINIVTDSVTYVKHENNEYIETGCEIGTWRRCNPVESKTDTNNLQINNINNIYAPLKTRGILIKAPAGAGKSTRIMQHITTMKYTEKDYIILSPSHKSLVGFRNMGLHCDVIQKYGFKDETRDTLMNYKCVIVDEYFYSSTQDIIFVFGLMYAGISVICMGDPDQLLPVQGDPHNMNHNLFYTLEQMDNNFRNPFSKQFYANCITGSNPNRMKLIEKYLSSEDGQLVCFRKETARKYNIANFTGKKPIPIRCTTNELREFGIYNNFMMYVDIQSNEKLDAEHFTRVISSYFPNGFINMYNDYVGNIAIPSKLSMHTGYFDLGYCINIHLLQGSECDSIYYCREDIDKLDDNRTFYTLISRLKFSGDTIEDFPQTQAEHRKLLNIRSEETSFKLSDMSDNAKRGIIIWNEKTKAYMAFHNKKELFDYIYSFPRYERNFHEVIFGNNVQRLKFDIDFPQGTHEDEAIRIVGTAVDHILLVVNTIYNDLPYKLTRTNNVIVTSSCDISKQSYHIIIKGISVANNVEAEHLHDQVRKSYPEISKYLDHTNKSIQNFRILGCCKVNSKRIKLISSDFRTASCFDEESLIQFNTMDIIPYNKVYPKLSTHRPVEDLVPSQYADLIKDIVGDSHEFRCVVGSMLYFDRLQPSYCKLCKREHQKDNTLMIRIINGVATEMCRHFVKKKY